jgi:hypothetical protein
MRRNFVITAAGIGVAGALGALLMWSVGGCGPWSVLGCHGADPELTRLIR